MIDVYIILSVLCTLHTHCTSVKNIIFQTYGTFAWFVCVVLDTQISVCKNSLNVYAMPGRVPSYLSKAAVKADILPWRLCYRRLLDSSHANWIPGIPGLSIEIVYPALVESLDICLRNFYIGSWHNGIQSRLTRKSAAAAIRINVSSSCALGRFSVTAAVVRTVKLDSSNRKRKNPAFPTAARTPRE